MDCVTQSECARRSGVSQQSINELVARKVIPLVDCSYFAFVVIRMCCRAAAKRTDATTRSTGRIQGRLRGCSSGTKAAGNPYYAFKKDANRFISDQLYSQGWADGFNVCKANYESIGR